MYVSVEFFSKVKLMIMVCSLTFIQIVFSIGFRLIGNKLIKVKPVIPALIRLEVHRILSIIISHDIISHNIVYVFTSFVRYIPLIRRRYRRLIKSLTNVKKPSVTLCILYVRLIWVLRCTSTFNTCCKIQSVFWSFLHELFHSFVVHLTIRIVCLCIKIIPFILLEFILINSHKLS